MTHIIQYRHLVESRSDKADKLNRHPFTLITSSTTSHGLKTKTKTVAGEKHSTSPPAQPAPPANNQPHLRLLVNSTSACAACKQPAARHRLRVQNNLSHCLCSRACAPATLSSTPPACLLGLAAPAQDNSIEPPPASLSACARPVLRS
ncbi:hypothetical protein NPIL_192761 [Nephila pilipes]|uniref:Uncharacterized protein n=1 Tax=Nephila pilipes TaxID=299642 RepID=A0A8X6SYV3_NEPPI|nr:hypothetical protein NPIL_192761 [Nephila pilipes]